MKKVFKYLSYTIIYLLISLASAYGVITVSLNNSNRLSSKGDNPSKPSSPSLPTQLTKVVENFSNSKYISFNVVAELDTSYDNFIISVDTQIDLSEGLSEIKAGGNINAMIESTAQNYNIEFAYQNGTAYFDLFNGKLSIDTKNIIKPINQILELLEIELPDIASILGEMDFESILGLFSNLTEKQDETNPDVIDLLITLPMIEEILTLKCDKDYKVNALLFDYNSEDISANIKAEINYPEQIAIKNVANEEYVKVNTLLDVAIGVINYIKTNENFAVDINAKYNGFNVTGKAFYNQEKQESKITMYLADKKINLILKNNTIYLEFENVYLKFKLSDYNLVCDFIENCFNVSLPVEDLINLLKDFDKDEFINKLKELGFEMPDLNMNDLSILEKVYVEDGKTNIVLKNIGLISIGLSNDILDSIAFVGNDAEIALNTISYKDFDLNVDEKNYIDIIDILPTIENVVEIVNANSIGGTIVVNYKNISLPIDVLASIDDDYIKLTTNIKNFSLTIEKLGEQFYLNFDNKFKVMFSIEELIDEIIKLLSDIDSDIDLSNIKDIITDLNKILSPEAAPLLIKELTKTENGIIVTLFNDISVSIENGSKQLSISSNFDSIDFSATIVASDETIIIPSFNDEEYTKIEEVLELAKVIINCGILNVVEGSVNFLAQKTFGFDFAAVYDKYKANGNIFIDIENLKLYLNGSFENENFNIILDKNIVYLEYKNIFVKFDIFDSPTVLEMINSEFGLNIPVELITKLLNSVQSGDIDNVVDTIKGEFDIDINLDEFKFDISKIDKSFFENITTIGNKTIIPFGDNTIAVEITDKMLSKIEFIGYGANVTANVVEYIEKDLQVNKESYINIVDLLPTLQNILDILKSDTISGTFNIENEKYNLSFDYKIIKNENLYIEISTNIYDLPITINYLNNKIYFNADNKVMLVSEINNLEETIKQFIKDINLEIDTNQSEIADKLTNILHDILNPEVTPLLIKGFIKTQNGFIVTLFNDISVSIENGSKQLSISSNFDSIDFSATIVASDETIIIPSFNDEEYTKIEEVLELAKVIINCGILNVVEGSANFLAQKTFGFDFDAVYDKYNTNGNIFIDIENLKLYLNAYVENESFNIILDKNIVYLEYKNIFVKFNIFDSPTVLEIINNEFGLNIPVELITKLLNSVQSGDIDNVVDTIKGEFDIDINLDEFKFDISKIDKSFFENITTIGNKIIIPFGDNTIAVEITDKMLSKIEYSGYGANVTANVVEYIEKDLQVNKESYINIVDLLPTLQNILDILRSDTISGTFDITSNALEIPMTFKIDKSQGLYAEFIATVYQGVISIYYENNKVYINIFNQIKLVCDLAELPEAIEELTDGLDTLIDPILDLIGLSKEVVDSFEENDQVNPLFSQFELTEDGIIMVVNGIKFSLTNRLQELLISACVDSLNIQGSIKGSQEQIEKFVATEDYVNIKEIFRLVNAAKNMSKREDFHVKGFVDLKLGELALDTVEFDIYIKVVNKKLQLIIEFPNIPTIPFVTKGLFENVKNRSTKIYFLDETIYMLREETKDNKLRKQAVKLTANSLMSDIYTYIQFAFGFTDTIMNQIKKPAEKYRQSDTINLDNVLSDFSIKENTEHTQTNYNLTLNIAEIADNKVLGKLNLRLYVGENENGESYLQELGMNMSILDGFVNLATPLKDGQDDKDKIIKIVDYGKNIDYKIQELYDYHSSYTFAYDTMMEKTGDGEWVKTNEVLRTITFVTNSDTQLPQISAPYKTEITLPTLETIIDDDGITKTIMTFAGWYTTENFDENSLFTNVAMPQNDITLYAKWNKEVLRYSTINFITFNDISIENITSLEGEELALPTLNNYQIVAPDGKTVSTYSFAGWFTDENLTEKFDMQVMPNYDVTLYASWKLESIEYAHQFNLYDNGNLIYSVYIAAGNDIDLSGIDKINEVTKFYLDGNYNDEFTSSLIMPEYNLSLHIRNKYTLSVKSEYGNTFDYVLEYWQGQNFAVSSQEDYYLDDGTQTQRDYYFFKGYSINGIISEIPSLMPNQNTEIVAVWENETKYYYTVNFDMRWYKVDGCGPAHKLKVEAQPIEPIVLLEGSELDLTNYQPTCIAQKTLIYNNVTYKATSWGTSAWASGTKGGSGFTSIIITSDTTLYACWQEQ